MGKFLTHRYVKIGSLLVAMIGVYMFFTTIITIEKGEMTAKSDIKSSLLPAYVMFLFVMVPFFTGQTDRREHKKESTSSDTKKTCK